MSEITQAQRVERVKRWLLVDKTPTYLLQEADVLALLDRIAELERVVEAANGVLGWESAMHFYGYSPRWAMNELRAAVESAAKPTDPSESAKQEEKSIPEKNTRELSLRRRDRAAGRTTATRNGR